MSRRGVLAGTGAASLGFVMSGAVGSVFGGTAYASGGGRKFTGYGDLVPDPAGVVDLPKGFRYKVLSRAGVDTLKSGDLVPGVPDGMAAFSYGGNNSVLVRNHELSPGDEKEVAPVPHQPGIVYDPGAPGGTTTLYVAGDTLLGQVASLAGTDNNCAGGPTPWNTWLSCEETEDTPEDEPSLSKRHGYVFEVDPFGRLKDAEAVPLTALGRFAHEAVAVDPKKGALYLTEDSSEPFGLLYRFLPNKPLGGPGSLRAGGKLQALQVPGVPDLSTVTELFTKLPVTWVDVPEPDATTTSVRKQFEDGKITRSQKLEGIYWARGSAYVVCSYAVPDDGAPGEHVGQVWRLDPAAGKLELVLHLAPGGTFDSPDNITVSSYGPIVLCEDGDGDSHLIVAGPDGTPYPLARNAVSESEWAGATFSHDGTWLYANIQSDGLTVAITGPWWKG